MGGTHPDVLKARLLAKAYRHETGCWLWVGAKKPGGYGNAWVDGHYENAHRLAYRLFIGPIPPGLHVLHRCDNPPCVRPDHLFLGTDADNTDDMWKKGRNPVMPVLKGERAPSAVLTDQAVAAIRERHRAGGNRQVDLAKEYGVTQSTISKVIRGATWSHV